MKRPHTYHMWIDDNDADDERVVIKTCVICGCVIRTRRAK